MTVDRRRLIESLIAWVRSYPASRLYVIVCVTVILMLQIIELVKG
jgi:hypothetical protein